MSSPTGVGRHSPISHLNRTNDKIQPQSSSHNEALQVGHSTSPPINPLQLQFKTLTENPTPWKPNTTSEGLKRLLRDDLQKHKAIVREDSLEYAKQHMMMEGRLLGSDEAKGMSFEQVQVYLESMGRAPHSWIDGAEEASKLKEDMKTLAKSGGNFDVESFKSVLTDHAKRLADQLIAYDMLYKDALATSEGSEKEFIELSHKSFRDYAARAIDHIAEHVPATIDRFLTTRLDEAERAARQPDLEPGDKEAADHLVNQWQGAKNSFSGAKGVLQVEKLKKSFQPIINNIGLEERIAELKADRASILSNLKVFTNNGVPQAIASTGHFGAGSTATREYTKAQGWHPVMQAVVNGLGLAAAHKFMTDIPRAGFHALLNLAFKGTVTPVNPTEVYPDALGFSYANGRKSALGKDQVEAAQAEVIRKRAHFKHDQMTGNFGTSTGDNIYHWVFGIANVCGTVFTEVGKKTVHPVLLGAIESGSAGLIAGGTMGLTKFRTTSGDDNIPTHKRTKGEVPEGVLKFAKKAVFEEFIPTKGGDGVSDWVGKTAGAVQGELVATAALGSARKLLSADTLQHQVGRIFLDLLAAPAILSSFLPNVEQTAKKAADDYHLKGSQRWEVAKKDLTDPNWRSKELLAKFPDEDQPLSGYVADRFTSINTFANGLARLVPQTLVSGQKWLGERFSKNDQGDTTEREMDPLPGGTAEPPATPADIENQL